MLETESDGSVAIVTVRAIETRPALRSASRRGRCAPTARGRPGGSRSGSPPSSGDSVVTASAVIPRLNSTARGGRVHPAHGDGETPRVRPAPPGGWGAAPRSWTSVSHTTRTTRSGGQEQVRTGTACAPPAQARRAAAGADPVWRRGSPPDVRRGAGRPGRRCRSTSPAGRRSSHDTRLHHRPTCRPATARRSSRSRPASLFVVVPLLVELVTGDAFLLMGVALLLLLCCPAGPAPPAGRPGRPLGRWGLRLTLAGLVAMVVLVLGGDSLDAAVSAVGPGRRRGCRTWSSPAWPP